MQVIDAFAQVQTSFSLFINNWTVVTELRSIRKRLREFEANLDKHSSPGRGHPSPPTVSEVLRVGKNTIGGSGMPAGA
jgi:peptide/bleomycin uptake transporter